MTFKIFTKYRQAIYGISAFFIIFHHFGKSLIGFLPSNISVFLMHHFFGPGFLGVDVFLILSGLSLYFSWQHNRPMTFYLKRLIRILPAIWCIVLPLFVVTHMLKTYNPIAFAKDISLNLFLMNNAFGIWYIPFILLMYFLYPVFNRLLCTENKNINHFLLFLSLILCILLNFYIYKTDPTGYKKTSYLYLRRIASFIIGCYLGKLVYEDKKIQKRDVYLLNTCTFLFIVYLIICPKGFIASLLWPVYALGLLWLLIKCFNARFNSQCALFKYIQAFFVFTGSFSLELYLSHWIFGSFWFPSIGINLIKSPCYITAIMLIIAYAFAYLVERGTRPFKNSILNAIKKRRP